ncbi:alpha/beta fold hydrolase [Arthrobacter sp. zg-Y1219]|uniref:alpha/beta fold hydrolase n=1 Tax=Arthrobacter sp. zg-Y1219 TaxID=3049067 RepID=UPI0024C2F808|nr:alpha/beta fold hydrolase [Arthrobacter sp. zg-Y1219]MDK1358867.1 alpha/beta fold hydrolase [Arthrobacter sp. zg-Y1219]
MTTHTNSPTILLIPGHWLGAWAWDEVLEHLTAMGRRAVPLTLPGLDGTDPDRASRTLHDQTAAVEQAMAGETGPVVIVAHSGASTPVSLVLDRHPHLIRRVIWVDSGPVASGTVFDPGVPAEMEELPLPSFEALGQQASLDGLNADVLERFRTRAVPEPGPVLRQPVELGNEERFKVPATLVCCSIPSTQMMELARSGHPVFAEVARLENLDLIDLPTGHWPMWSRPADLAGVLAAASRTD